MKPARLRPLAEVDLVVTTQYDEAHGGESLAERFFDAAATTLRAIERMPQSGSPEVGEACRVPGLRVRRVPKFPYAWYYFVGPDEVDVVRLLADSRDLTTILGLDE